MPRLPAASPCHDPVEEQRQNACALVTSLRRSLQLTQAELASVVERSPTTIANYEKGASKPPAIFFHDLLDTAPQCELHFNEIASVAGYRRIESMNPDTYSSLHDFVTGIRVLTGHSRATFATTLKSSAALIASIERGIKPNEEFLHRLAKRHLEPAFSYRDIVRRFRTLRPTDADRRVRAQFRRLHDPETPKKERAEIRSTIARDHVPLARQLANKEAHRSGKPQVADDAWTIALTRAIQRHNPRYGDFVPFLQKWVFGVVKQEIAGARSPGISACLRGSTRVVRAIEIFRQQLHREPTSDELAAHLRIPVAKARRVLDALSAQRTTHLDAIGSKSVLDIDTSMPAHALTFGPETEGLLATLDGDLRKVIELHFAHELTVAEIANELHVDAATSDEMLKRAIQQLRERVEASRD